MAASQFVIQVVDTETGKVVEWAPGMAVERQLLTDLGTLVAAKIATQKVGLFVRASTVTTLVAAAAQEALKELLRNLKSDVHPGRTA